MSTPTRSTPTRSTAAQAAAQTPAHVINFDDLRCEIVKVTKRGQTWDLRDDIPMAVMMQAFALKSVGERLQALGKDDGEKPNEDEIQAAFDAVDAETVPICTDIFRHSYPDTTDEEIAALFSMEERMQLIQLFFQRRSTVLHALPGATSDVSAAATALGVAAAPNRTARRASRRATTPRLPR